jgi:hypothetical protein
MLGNRKNRAEWREEHVSIKPWLHVILAEPHPWQEVPLGLVCALRVSLRAVGIRGCVQERGGRNI